MCHIRKSYKNPTRWARDDSFCKMNRGPPRDLPAQGERWAVEGLDLKPLCNPSQDEGEGWLRRMFPDVGPASHSFCTRKGTGEEARMRQKQQTGGAVFSAAACTPAVQNQGRTRLGQVDIQGAPGQASQRAT